MVDVITINPLHPHTRAWLRELYALNAVRRCERGASIEKARKRARKLALSFRDALLPGPDGDPPVLIQMEDNVIVREMQAGIVPEEFRKGEG